MDQPTNDSPQSHQSEAEGSPLLDEERYRRLFETSADAILIIQHGVFIDCNAAAVELMGYTDKAALLQVHPSELSPEYQPDGQRSFDKANAIMTRARSVRNQRFEWTHTRENGETFPVEVLLTSVMSSRSDGDLIIHTVLRDISERKRLEMELRHSQKMDVVGKLAGGVAHDFNNQLVPILGYSDLLVTALEGQPKLREWAQEIHRASTFASALVNKLLAFSRKENRKPVVLNVTETVRALTGLLRKLVGENFAVECRVPEGALWIRADAGDIEQILLNLCANARDALSEGGQILIELERVGAGEVSLRVADNGAGMDVATQNQMFEPFFTTKALGSGTGLGLSTVNELVMNAGGRITVSSTPGEGTAVEVRLPEVSAPVPEVIPETRVVEGEVESRQSRILVVEDDRQISLFIERVLEAEGYLVATVSDGAEALRIINLRVPDLVLTDVVMASISGPRMAQELAEQGIDVPVIFMSGYTDDRLEASGFDSTTVSLVRKPFTAQILLAQIRAALRTPGTGDVFH